MTLDELLGPDWQRRAAAYTYHGQTGAQLLSIPGGAVPLGDGFLQKTSTGGYDYFTDNGTNNQTFDSTGNATGSYQGNEAGITGQDIISSIGVVGAGMGLGALATGAMGAGAAGAAGAAGGEASAAGEAGLASDVGSLGSASAFTGAGGTMTAGDGLALGDGFTAGDLSFGSDGALDTAGTMSSLGSSLGGGTGFNSLLPFLGSLASGLGAKKSAGTANDLAQQLINRSDPFASQRAGYGQKLQALEASHDVTSIPGYQAGLEAVQRAGAAQGFTGSGNMMKSLQDYGGNFYNTELQRLAHLAGADATPGAGFGQAAGLIGQGQASGQFGNQQLIQALGQGGNLFNSFSGGGGGGMVSPGNPMPTIGAGGGFSSTDLMAG